MGKCWLCGAEATKTRDITKNLGTFYSIYSVPVLSKYQRCYCDKCFEEYRKQLYEENRLYIQIKHKRMFETALDKLEHQEIIFEKYREAIKTVEEYNLENLSKFDSSYEIIAAIILIHNRFRIRPQQKVGKYQVDFLLPDDHIVLEIDGDRHKGRKKFDSERDLEIKQILGGDWDIIRIPTEHLDKHADRLIDAIEHVLDYRTSGKVNWRAI